MLDIRKLLFCCLCSLAVLASTGMAGNVMTNGTLTGSWAGWTYLATPGATGTMYAVYDSVEGNPTSSGGSGPGCVKCWTNDVTVSTNSWRVGQVLRVNKGQNYRLTGYWKGDMRGLESRNWAEIFVGFFDTEPTADQWGSIVYKKAYTGGPNCDLGYWDWESILSSPDGTGPSNGVFMATGSYMTVSVNQGGRANAVDETHPAWVYIDDFKVVPCHDEYGSDCAADFKYVAWIASNWLVCNIDPATSCW